MTDTQAIRKLHEAATKGEWRSQHDHSGDVVFDKNSNVVAFVQIQQNAAFIAAAHAAIPAMCAEIEGLRAEVELWKTTAQQAVQRINEMESEADV